MLDQLSSDNLRTVMEDLLGAVQQASNDEDQSDDNLEDITTIFENIGQDGGVVLDNIVSRPCHYMCCGKGPLNNN